MKTVNNYLLSLSFFLSCIPVSYLILSKASLISYSLDALNMYSLSIYAFDADFYLIIS